MNIDDTFPRESNWINHTMLKGREVRLTIAAIDVVEWENGKIQPALAFQGTEKKFSLNVTNRETIKASYGVESDDWIGKDIIMFKTTTPFGGKGVVDCVRVRCPVQEATGLPQQTQATKVAETAKASGIYTPKVDADPFKPPGGQVSGLEDEQDTSFVKVGAAAPKPDSTALDDEIPF